MSSLLRVPQLSAAVSAAQPCELTHSVTTTVTKLVSREKVSAAVRQTRESPPPQKKRQVVVDSELRKRWTSSTFYISMIRVW